MSHQSALIGVQSSNADATQAIRSRFGEITVVPGKAIRFPRGLLGMPDKFNFALANFPSEKMQQFTLLQSLDDHALSFITLPLPMENAILTSSDIKSAYHDLQIAEVNGVMLLIVTVHRSAAGTRLSVNARAPLFIDADRRVGVQYVFQNDAYKVQHMLG